MNDFLLKIDNLKIIDINNVVKRKTEMITNSYGLNVVEEIVFFCMIILNFLI